MNLIPSIRIENLPLVAEFSSEGKISTAMFHNVQTQTEAYPDVLLDLSYFCVFRSNLSTAPTNQTTEAGNFFPRAE